ncbi:hypothetical protein EI555_010912 [Monodon monoceros]|uniref:Uncharacterized protein n=1 Tax=Monodon monoceros TaxID=40151 RepID=A0A4U1EWI8_MONMO|nr:hypothetical protein EI555_010912 [Monodon monoceros]
MVFCSHTRIFQVPSEVRNDAMRERIEQVRRRTQLLGLGSGCRPTWPCATVWVCALGGALPPCGLPTASPLLSSPSPAAYAILRMRHLRSFTRAIPTQTAESSRQKSYLEAHRHSPGQRLQCCPGIRAEPILESILELVVPQERQSSHLCTLTTVAAGQGPGPSIGPVTPASTHNL